MGGPIVDQGGKTTGKVFEGIWDWKYNQRVAHIIESEGRTGSGDILFN